MRERDGHDQPCLVVFAAFAYHFYMAEVFERVWPGNEVRRTGPCISPVSHFHSEIELNLITAGRGAYFFDNAHYDASPAALVWMLPNQSHRLLPGPDLQMWVVTCSSDSLDRSFLDDVAAHSRCTLARDDALSLDRLITHISQEADDPQVFRKGIDYALRSALRLSKLRPETSQVPLHPAVLSAMRILRDAPDIANAAELAARCGVSQAYLRELMIEQTGRGFVEWRNRFRLERFQILYPRSGNLLTAALDAGFGSYAQFHRVFEAVVGTSPSRWVTGERGSASAPIAALARTPDAKRGGMLWYDLVDLVFNDARRWITPAFSKYLAEDPIASDHEYAPIASHVVASYDQQRFKADLLADVAAHREESAEHLRIMFERLDLFADNTALLSLWGFDLSDMAPLIATHLITAWIAAFDKPIPGRASVRSFVDRVASALNASGSFAAADAEDRRLAMAALCVQSYIMRSAANGANNSENAERIEDVRKAATASMLQTYGVVLADDLLSI